MKKFVLIATFPFLLMSCSISEHYMADDVYVVKPSNLAVGESTADETSYAAFKERKTGQSNDRQVFSDVNNSGFNNNPFGWSPNFFGNGYGWFLYSSQFPYGNRSLHWNNLGYDYWFYYDNLSVISYGWHNGVWNGNSFGYQYPQNYGNGWCNNFYGYNYYGFNGYGFNGNGVYGGFGNYSASNIYSGPRGSTSGYANPNGRKYESALKNSSHQTSASIGSSGRSVSTRTSSQRIETKPIHEIGDRPVTRPTTYSSSGRAVTSETQNRTYVRSDRAARPMNSTYQSQNGGGRNSVSVETNRNGGSSISISGRSSEGSSSRSSGSSTSGGSSRSSGNSGGSSGRRQ